MPVDLSKDSAASDSRSSRTGGPTGRDRDARRTRGEISCAECRRLKLKCDKKIPCTSCTRRGCGSICPTGTLSAGQGTRFILADTAELHAKIAQMGDRIRQLEDALAEMQRDVSPEPHPLLVEPYLSIKQGVDSAPAHQDTEYQSQPSVAPVLVEAFGTITLGIKTESKYFGPAAGSEALFLSGASTIAEAGHCDTDEDETDEIPAEIQKLPSFLSIGSDANVENTLEILFKYLPSESRADYLCENYVKYSASAFRPITRDELFEEYLTPIYARLKKYRQDIESGLRGRLDYICPHKVSVIFLALSLGALSDPDLGPDNKESALYFRLSCCSLGIRSIFDSPERATVQAMSMMATYHATGGNWYSLDCSWVLTQLALIMAHSLGMHRDPEKWSPNPVVVQRRRGLFWELLCNDEFYSCSLGRPAYVRLSCTDTKFPSDEALAQWEPNTVSYYRWKYEYMADQFPKMMKSVLTPSPPQYATVIELDRRIQEKPLPPELRLSEASAFGVPSTAVHLQQWFIIRYRAIALLFLHRRYFSQVMLTHAADPLRSPFAPSFLAAYRAASEVIKSSIGDFDRFPKLSSRFWGLWTHLFSAAIVVGSIVIRSPQCPMGPSAFIELGLACAMFEKGAKESLRARSGLDVLNRIRDQANQAYSRFLLGNGSSPDAYGAGTDSEHPDELSIFAGRTRVLISRILSRDSTSNRSPESVTPGTGATSSPGPTETEDDGPRRQWSAADSFADGHMNSEMLVGFLNEIPITDARNQAPIHYDEDRQFRGHVSQGPPPPVPEGYANPPDKGANAWQGGSWQGQHSNGTSFAQPLPPPQQSFLESHFRNQQGDGGHFSAVVPQSGLPDPSAEMNEQWMSFVHAFGLSDVVTNSNQGPRSTYPHDFPFQY